MCVFARLTSRRKPRSACTSACGQSVSKSLALVDSNVIRSTRNPVAPVRGNVDVGLTVASIGKLDFHGLADEACVVTGGL